MLIKKKQTNWFVDNKLSIHFEEDKTISMLFLTKKRKKNMRILSINYGYMKM